MAGGATLETAAYDDMYANSDVGLRFRLVGLFEAHGEAPGDQAGEILSRAGDGDAASFFIGVPQHDGGGRDNAGADVAWHQAQPGGELPTGPKRLRIAHGGHHRAGR